MPAKKNKSKVTNQSCCLSTARTKKCIRKLDNKIFTFPRKYSKEDCLTKPIKGFTMRASCAPYLGCLRQQKRVNSRYTKRRVSLKKKIKKKIYE